MKTIWNILFSGLGYFFVCIGFLMFGFFSGALLTGGYVNNIPNLMKNLVITLIMILVGAFLICPLSSGDLSV
jgi:hypothetical protein